MASKKKPSSSLSLVGDGLSSDNARWRFSAEVSEKFEEHAERSIPDYRQNHQLILELSDFFIQNDSRCYELGCSTAALISQLAERHGDTNAEFHGLDTEAAMVEQARARVGSLKNLIVSQADICQFDYQPADFIVAYYTVQFVPPKRRQQLFDTIYRSLNWGGAFVLFEKVRGPDARFQDILSQLYTEYKLKQGYEPSEILAKSRSLKGVLEPFSTQGNLDLLSRAGFVDMMSIAKNTCFEGFLAIK